MIDTRRGVVAWEGRALPEGRRTLVNDASFHREGELLIVRGGSTVLAELKPTVLEEPRPLGSET